MGKASYRSLKDIPKEEKIDLVNVFRPSGKVLPIVKEALERDIQGIWMQEGIRSEEGRKMAEEKGIRW